MCVNVYGTGAGTVLSDARCHHYARSGWHAQNEEQSRQEASFGSIRAKESVGRALRTFVSRFRDIGKAAYESRYAKPRSS